jgi:hypothetical protein
MNFNRHSSLPVLVNRSHLPFRFRDVYGSLFVLTPLEASAPLKSCVNIVAMS